VNCLDVANYLQQFGYFNPFSFDQSNLKDAINSYQITFGLPSTGVLDDATKTLMETPRCGVTDHVRRNAFVDKAWSKKSLTYYFHNYSPDLTKSQIRRITARSFQYWSDVSGLTFSEQSGSGDIVIAFGSKTHSDGRRQCGYPFDGASGTLAHAFFPPDGRLHFDEDEPYTDKSSTGINLMWVATHEIGHILGLEHDTDNNNAVMYPYYRAYNPDGMNLHSNDIFRIQKLYGSNSGVVPTAPPPPPKTLPPIPPKTQPPIPPKTQPPTGCKDLQPGSCRLNWFRVCDTDVNVQKQCKKTCNLC